MYRKSTENETKLEEEGKVEIEDEPDQDIELSISDDNYPFINNEGVKFDLSLKRKRRIRDDMGEWIDESELEGRTISHIPTSELSPSKPSKKKPKLESLNAADNPFHLVDPLQVAPPFKVDLSLSSLLLMDLHSHLSYQEVIGLLGGRFDEEYGILQISCVFPCNGIGTDVECEMDPISEMEACETFKSKGLDLVGWYHSHPTFKPSPSLRDIESQEMYQVIHH